MQSTAIIADLGIDCKTNKAKITFLFDNKNILGQAEELKNKKLTLEAKQFRNNRSLDANAYCWVLCDKIAKKIGNCTKEDVYKDAISYVGSFEPLIVEEKAFNKFKQVWERQGLGYLVKEVSRKNKCVKVFCYYGSSSYDTKEMSILIEFIANEAKVQGIETMPEAKLKSLLEQWH